MKTCKKCSREIPDDSKYKKCEDCRSQKWNRIKKVGAIAAGAAAATLAIIVATRNESSKRMNILSTSTATDRLCDECGTLMEYHPALNYGDGYWECPKCYNSITEDDIDCGYDEAFDVTYDIDDYDNILSEPGCCECGNPAYPKCKTSCPMFDD